MPQVVTWNMQGGNASTEIKWHTGIGNLLHEIAPIICAQECGGIPPSADIQPGNLGGDPAYRLYWWGTERTRKYISFYFWDVNGNRVNQAIISEVAPTAWLVVLPAAGPIWRPAIGALIGGVWYFCLHGISPGGADAAGLLAQIPGLVGATPWIACGDYNREPAPALPTGNVCPPNNHTYSVNNPIHSYDYAYRSGPGVIGTRLNNLIMSDHYAVHLAF